MSKFDYMQYFFLFKNKKSGNPGYLIGEPVIAGTLDNITIIVNPDR
jgi:hypothetical protein